MSNISPKIRAVWVLIVGLALVFTFLSRLEHHSATHAEGERQRVTVERIPSSEARLMGIAPRNH